MAHDLVPDDALQQQVREATDRIVRRLIAHQFRIVDQHGQTTTWGDLAPDTLEENLNALIALSLVKTAHHLTGDPVFQEAYTTLVRRQQYPQRAAHIGPEWRAAGGTRNYSDLFLGWLALSQLLRLEENPALREGYRQIADDVWDLVQEHGNAFASFVYHAGTETPFDDPLALRTLAFLPIEKRAVEVRAAGRQDVGLVTPSRQGTLQGELPLPVEERPVDALEWRANPFRLEGHRGSHGEIELTAVDYLLAYWCGRYHGFIGAEPIVCIRPVSSEIVGPQGPNQ